MSGVLLASTYARRLVEREATRSGVNVKAAIGTVARRLRAPHGTIWGLLFRTPKRVGSDLLDALEAAVVREISSEIRALEHELESLTSRSSFDRRIDPGSLAEVEADLARLKGVLSREAR